MLDTNLKQQLNTYLQNIVTPIELTLTTNDSDKSRELADLTNEIAELSDKISVKAGNDRRARAWPLVRPVRHHG